MNALIIGGERHGEWVDVLDGAGGWVNIRTGDTYRIRKLGWGVTRLSTEGLMELTGEQYKVRLAVHPLIAADSTTEQAIATELLKMLAMNEFIRAHGDLVLPEPVPDTVSELLGPDGGPAVR